jgi:hypothetical protein
MLFVFVFGGTLPLEAEQNESNVVQFGTASAISLQQLYSEFKPCGINEDFPNRLVFSSYVPIGYTPAMDNRIPVPTFPWSMFHYSRWDYSLYTTVENTFFKEQSSQHLRRNSLYTN